MYKDEEDYKAYTRAYSKRAYKAKKLGVDPKSLGPLSDFYDDPVRKQEKIKKERRPKIEASFKSEYQKIWWQQHPGYKSKNKIVKDVESIDPEVKRQQYLERKRKNIKDYRLRHHNVYDRKYYKKNAESIKLEKFANYYNDLEKSREYYANAATKYRFKHKNDKTWWQKLISYIRGLRWVKIIKENLVVLSKLY